MSKLLAFSLSQRLVMLILMLLLVAFGFMAFNKLPIDAFPDVSTTQVQIIMKAPGMTPEEVETQIVYPIEQEILGIPHKKILRSQSKYAIAIITLEFDEGTDPYWARQQVNERLAGVLTTLPNGVNGGIAPMTTPLGEMFMFTIEGPLDPMAKRLLLERDVRPHLREIAGVADVNTLGGFVKTFEVSPNLSALAARGISLSQLQEAITRNHNSDGAGRLQEHGESILVRSDSRIKTLEDLQQLVIHNHNGQAIFLVDVADIKVGHLTRYGAVTKNGQGEAVEAIVLGLRGANARQLVADVEARLKIIEKNLPKGVILKPFYNRGELVNRAIHTVNKALFEAVALVLILLLLFLGNIRAAFVVAIVLPLSSLGTFLLMDYVGLSANLMSLGGLAIAIGLLVDAAVVVVENIEANIAEAHHKNIKVDLLHLIYRSVQEVSVPVISGMSIIVLVFMPLLSLEGLEGKLFKPVAITIIFALLTSLLISLTVIPVLASFLIKNKAHATPYVVLKLESWYEKVLLWSLSHQRTVYMYAGIGLLLAIISFPFIGKAFMPTLDEGDIIMQIEKIPSINLNTSIKVDLQVQQKILAKVPEIKEIIARTGSDELGLDPMGLNETDTFLVLKPKSEWTVANKEELVDKIRDSVKDIPGVNFSFTQPIEMRTSEMLSGVRGDLAIKIFGSDLATLNTLAENIADKISSIKGNQDVMTLQNEGILYLQVEIDRAAITRLGLDSENVQNQLRLLVEGKTIASVLENGKPMPLVIKGNEDIRMSKDVFSSMNIPLSTGGSVPLSAIANLVSTEGVVKIERENASRMSVVRANVSGRDLVGFVEEAKNKIAREVKLPTGYYLQWGGQFENQQRAAKRLMTVIPAALALIFFILFLTLASVKQAALVFVNIPFAMIGGVFALLITREYLSVPASVGFIALMGIAVLNGLVLISYFNQLMQKGYALQEAVKVGAMRRLRPVMMTATIAALGLIPLLLATGPGSEIQRPLAIVVIGGLVSSTLLTLIILPNLFIKFSVRNSS